jgi:CRISPR-associated protein Cas5t
LKIENVNEIDIFPVEEGRISGCMLPFNANLQAGGQLVQLAESFIENEEIGAGRIQSRSKIFLSIPYDSRVQLKHSNLFKTQDDKVFYLHQFDS